MSRGKRALNFGIRIRHVGFVDRYAATQPHPYYPETDINAWTTSDQETMLRFGTRREAEAQAAELGDRFGDRGYRFGVIESRPVPHWFEVNPE